MRPEPHVEPFPRPDRLESWKEIAAYLNRSERTVRRWEEKEALPVHRLQHDKRGSVYAYSSELDAWRDSRQLLVSGELPEAGPAKRLTGRPAWRWLAGSSVIVFAALVSGFLLFSRRPAPAAISPSPEALRAFQQGEFAGNAGRVQVLSGIRYYQEAIRLEPTFARAWSALACAHIAQTFFGDRPAKETLAQARQEAQRAAQLDPSLVMPGTALAAISHYADWDHASAEGQFRKSIVLAPHLAVTHSWFSELLLDLRRFDEAAVSARRAHEAAPRWLEPLVVAGNIHAFSGHLDLAIAEYQRALATEPAFGLANHFLGRAYLAKGEGEKAIAQLRKSNELLGEVPFSIGHLGYALALSGAHSEAERMLADALARRAQGSYPAFPIAEILMGLGRPDAALQWLERAADERHVGYYMPSVDPIYDPLRSDPKFRALMQRMNLPH